MSEKAIMIVFLVIFAAHLVVGFWFLKLNKNTKLKKQYFPFSVAMTGLIFAGLMFVQFYPVIYFPLSL